MSSSNKSSPTLCVKTRRIPLRERMLMFVMRRVYHAGVCAASACAFGAR